ncbi:hypothetical protein [Citreimonas sp.]|uniref:hypothetical protein n=1 Tax=Citreimonas sp. TaxID=3036715 RepID=UPI004059E83F
MLKFHENPHFAAVVLDLCHLQRLPGFFRNGSKRRELGRSKTRGATPASPRRRKPEERR